MPQEIGEVYKSLIPTLSDDASIEQALQMYHYGTASYNGSNANPNSIERHFVSLNSAINSINTTIANLGAQFIEETSLSTRPNIITAQNQNVVPLTLKGSDTQVQPILKLQKGSDIVGQISNSGGAAFLGYVGIGTTTVPTSTALAITLGSDIVGMTVRGIVGQTAKLQEWQNNSGTVVASVSNDGTVYGLVGSFPTLNATGIAYLNDVIMAGTATMSGNIDTTGDIFARKIILTKDGDNLSISTTGNATIGGTLNVTGKSTFGAVDVSGVISSTASIATTSDISASGTLSGEIVSSTANIVAGGIIKAHSPNSGTAGGVRIIGDAGGNSYLEFVNAADTTQLAYVKASSGFLESAAEIVSTNALRLVSGNYGGFIKNDGAAVSINITASGSQYGASSIKPISISNTTGYTTVISPVGSGSVGLRNMYISTADPVNTTGANGDIWIKYVA